MEFSKTAAAAILPPGFAALMKKVEAQAKATKPAKPKRKTLLSDVERAIALGKEPPRLEFATSSNYTYNRHADALHKLWKAGDLAGLKGYEISGKNTYARALAKYRDLLVKAAS